MKLSWIWVFCQVHVGQAASRIDYGNMLQVWAAILKYNKIDQLWYLVASEKKVLVHEVDKDNVEN